LSLVRVHTSEGFPKYRIVSLWVDVFRHGLFSVCLGW
jgi:hypothetical protein